MSDAHCRDLVEELADRADEINYLRGFIERTLVGGGFSSWVRFHIALQDYAHLIRDPSWRAMYLKVIAKAAATETNGGLPERNVLTSMSTSTTDRIAQSRRRRPG